jgi:hypothetical protein
MRRATYTNEKVSAETGAPSRHRFDCRFSIFNYQLPIPAQTGPKTPAISNISTSTPRHFHHFKPTHQNLRPFPHCTAKNFFPASSAIKPPLPFHRATVGMKKISLFSPCFTSFHFISRAVSQRNTLLTSNFHKKDPQNPPEISPKKEGGRGGGSDPTSSCRFASSNGPFHLQ